MASISGSAAQPSPAQPAPPLPCMTLGNSSFPESQLLYLMEIAAPAWRGS